jgi:hypothetical protein
MPLISSGRLHMKDAGEVRVDSRDAVKYEMWGKNEE